MLSDEQIRVMSTMTQAKWDALSPAERDRIRDTSGLHPKLRGLEGRKVRVSPSRLFGADTFRVGVSTDWRPCHLAMRDNARGSSDTISPNETFREVKVID